MKLFQKLIFFSMIVLSVSCNKKEPIVDKISETSVDLQMIEAYEAGIEELEKGNVLVAAKKFNEAELLYPQSKWAPRAALMSAYSYYSQDYYNDSIYELERFLKVYPIHERANYAYYLLAMSYYDQIVDEKKDLGPIINAKENFEIVIEKFPNSDFALDAEYKLDLIQEILASKEMYLARYYIEREKWIPAINRFKFVLENYDQSIFVEEAIHRLVEIYYRIGLIEESKKYAYLLGYNYQSSEWYENSYKVFNKDYKLKSKLKKKKGKNPIIKRIKSLLN